PNWQALDITPLEIAHRQKIGPVVAPELEQIMRAIKQSLTSPITPVTDYISIAPGACAAKSVAVLKSLLRGAA
ncbi:MAG: hypothetical protein ACK529_07185, partial [Alphaproteobacteria bacterium]